MSSGLASAVQFAGSLPGSILLTLGQTVVYLRENGVKPPTYTPF